MCRERPDWLPERAQGLMTLIKDLLVTRQIRHRITQEAQGILQQNLSFAGEVTGLFASGQSQGICQRGGSTVKLAQSLHQRGDFDLDVRSEDSFTGSLDSFVDGP